MGDNSSRTSRVLLVKGANDQHVIGRIRDKNNTLPAFHIEDKGSVGRLLESIAPECKVPERQARGMVIDANSKLQSRWKEIVSRLQKIKVSAPASPLASGAILSEKTSRVGIRLMPDNRRSRN